MKDDAKRYTMQELGRETEELALGILIQINDALTEFTKRTGVVVDLNVKLDGRHPSYTHDGDVCAPRQYHSWYFADVDVKPIMPNEAYSSGDREHQEELRIGFVAECEGKIYDDYLERWTSDAKAPSTPSASADSPVRPQDPQT